MSSMDPARTSPCCGSTSTWPALHASNVAAISRAVRAASPAPSRVGSQARRSRATAEIFGRAARNALIGFFGKLPPLQSALARKLAELDNR